MAFPDATTQSNTTHKSVPMLLSAASAEDFERLFHEKGILVAFKEAGFHTVFISNQLPNHSFIDFLGEQADEHYFLKKEDALQGNHYDEDLLQKLDEILPKLMLPRLPITVIASSSSFFIPMVLTSIIRSVIPVVSLISSR